MEMTVQEILSAFEGPTKLPRQAFGDARRQREAITPELLHLLEDAVKAPDLLKEDGGSLCPLFALFLLAEFQEPRAHGMMGRIFALPEATLDIFLGDVMTENVPQMLAATWRGDDSVIHGLVENREVCEWIRSSALKALVCLWVLGKKTREELVGYLRGLLDGRIEREPSHIWVTMACIVADLAIHELSPPILEAFDQGLVSQMAIRREEFEKDATRSGQPPPEVISKTSTYRPFSTVEVEIGWWSRWQERDQAGKKRMPNVKEMDRFLSGPIQTVVRKDPKVGRNEACPCGSGKKYKKCCGGGAKAD
jgi:hypothetical protein